MPWPSISVSSGAADNLAGVVALGDLAVPVEQDDDVVGDVQTRRHGFGGLGVGAAHDLFGQRAQKDGHRAHVDHAGHEQGGGIGIACPHGFLHRLYGRDGVLVVKGKQQARCPGMFPG